MGAYTPTGHRTTYDWNDVGSMGQPATTTHQVSPCGRRGDEVRGRGEFIGPCLRHGAVDAQREAGSMLPVSEER